MNTITIPAYDSKADYSDDWNTHPRSDGGSHATAYFLHAQGIACDARGDFECIQPVLDSLLIKGAAGNRLYRAKEARDLLGEDEVDRLENVHKIQVNGW